MRGGLALACLLSLLAPAARADDASPVRAAVERLVASGDLEGALVACEAALAAGEDPALRRLHADLLAWTGRLDLALVEYATLLRDAPDDEGLLLAVALAHKWQGDLVGAESEMAALAARTRDDAEVARELRLLREDPAFRLARAEAAVTQAPADVEALRTLVEAALERDAFWVAEPALERAGRLAPDDPAIGALRRDFEDRKTARLEARIAERRAALAAAGDDAALRMALADDLAALGRFAEAGDEYARVADADPGRRDARRQEARVRSWGGDMPEALALYDRLVEEAPGDDDLRLEQARVLAWDGQLARAARAVPPLDRLDGERAAARSVLGDVHRGDGRPARAAGFYQGALADGLQGDAARDAATFLRDHERYTQIGPWGESFGDSADFSANRIGGEIRRQATFATRAEARVQTVAYSQDGLDLNAQRATVSLGHEWTRFRGLAQVGVGAYDPGQTVPAFAAQLEFTPGPEQVLGIGYDRFDLIDEVMTVRSALGDVLQGDRGRLWLRQPLVAQLRLRAGGSFTRVTDGNQALAAHAALARRVFRRPRVELRLDTRYYSLADPSPLYWSPSLYLSGGLGVEAEHALREGIRLLVDARGGYATDDGRQAPEQSYGGRLAVDMIRGWEVNLGARYGSIARTVQGGGGYQAVTAFFELRYRLGTGLF